MRTALLATVLFGAVLGAQAEAPELLRLKAENVALKQQLVQCQVELMSTQAQMAAARIGQDWTQIEAEVAKTLPGWTVNRQTGTLQAPEKKKDERP